MGAARAGERGRAAPGHQQALCAGGVPVPGTVVLGDDGPIGQGDATAADEQRTVDREVGETGVAQGDVGQMRVARGHQGDAAGTDDGAT